MRLTLRVLRYQNRPPQRPLEVTVNGPSCRIGRKPENDLVLPDPDKLISSYHAEISLRDGQVMLTDRSTNGTYLPGQDRPIGKGNTVPLPAEAEFLVVDYLIHVALGTEERLPAADRDDDPLADLNADPLGAQGVGVSAGNEHDSTALDPLALIGESPNSPGAGIPTDFDPFDGLESRRPPVHRPPGQPPDADDGDDDLLADSKHNLPGEGPSQADHAPADHGTFRIPDDWDDEFGVLGEADPLASTPPEPAAESPDQAAGPANEPPVSEGIVTQPPHEPPTHSAEPAAAPTPEARVRDQASTRAIDPASDAAVQAFLRGAGLRESDLPGGQVTPEMLENAGVMVRQMTQGMLDTLAARMRFKRELRVEVTMIRAAENNPLKFSANVDEALRLLFRPVKGYLPPQQSIAEGFADLQGHEMALLQAVRTTLEALLARLSPKTLEREFAQKSMLDNLMPSARKARCWNEFVEIYDNIARDAEEGFMRLFAEEFARSYEDYERRLRQGRKR